MRNGLKMLNDISIFKTIQFAYNLYPQSKVIMKTLDSVTKTVEGVETWFAGRQLRKIHKRLPMFCSLPHQEFGTDQSDRCLPMSMYSSEDGMPEDFHLVHYGSRAQRGQGLSSRNDGYFPEGRITPGWRISQTNRQTHETDC